MNRVWELTDLEFMVLWERSTGARLLKPFTFTSRTPLLEDYERECELVWQQLQSRIDVSLRTAIETFHHPDVFVVGHGWNDQDIRNPESRIRVRAARSGAFGFVLTQLPGETIWHSGGFTIAECGPHGLAEAVVAALPTAAAGRMGQVAVSADRDEDPGLLRSRFGSLVTDDQSESAAAQSRRFFAIPATSSGVITVHQGRSIYGPRGILEQAMLWRDLPGDGRYVIPLDHAPVAMGISEQRLVRQLDAAVGTMLDRAETHWEARI